jgi:hypothetical protein
MQYFDVYERVAGSAMRAGYDLRWVARIRSLSPNDALTDFTDMYGDNYGNVVIIPQLDATKHTALQIA